VTLVLSDAAEDINQLVLITMPIMESVPVPLILTLPEPLDNLELAYQVAPKILSPSAETPDFHLELLLSPLLS